MGSSLRRDLREVLPAGIKGLQRAIALELADDARYDDGWRYNPEAGRRSKARLADLVRWTGAKDELSVREMLRRLAVAGWEFRLPIGTGKDGRPLYAVPGQAMQFRVPDFKGPTTVGPCVEEDAVGPTSVGPMETEGPTLVGEGPTTVGEGPTVVAEDPTTVGPPSQVLPSVSHQASPSSSPAEVVEAEPPSVADVTDGGGGGDSELRLIAERIEASLDYQGKQPGTKLRQTIVDRLVAALEAGWTVGGLAAVLDLTGQTVGYPPGVYAHRLKPEELEARKLALASKSPVGGIRGEMPNAAYYEALTEDDVFGPARQKTAAMAGGYQPYSNDPWYQPADPVEAAKIPWCKHWDCDEKTRLRGGQVCDVCHPSSQGI